MGWGGKKGDREGFRQKGRRWGRWDGGMDALEIMMEQKDEDEPRGDQDKEKCTQ